MKGIGEIVKKELKTTEVKETISEILKVPKQKVTDITVFDKGMTNHSFLFTINQEQFIMRIPGEGTVRMLDRSNEAFVYQTIGDLGICDDIIYINAQNGCRITKFWEGARTCDPKSMSDVKRCMRKLRYFHEQELQVQHEFDLFEQIEFYEKLWDGVPSKYSDYKITKRNILALKSYIERYVDKKVLTHIDAIPDNFLFVPEGEKESVRLIDWEYAGMQDPHVDIAMFSLYSLYNRKQIDQLIDLYFTESCSWEIRIKIYCYIAVGGLLWSNWCEYKRKFGVEYGEYAEFQYCFAKDYYRIVQNELE